MQLLVHTLVFALFFNILTYCVYSNKTKTRPNFPNTTTTNALVTSYYTLAWFKFFFIVYNSELCLFMLKKAFKNPQFAMVDPVEEFQI